MSIEPKLLTEVKLVTNDNKYIRPTHDFGLKTLASIMAIGVVIMLVGAIIFHGFKGFFSVFSLSGIIALAALFVGGFLGFLFGIPRSSSNATEFKKSPFGYNTNLQEVSDWLTKIIVGVSLTQLPAITNGLHNINNSVAKGFTGYMQYYYAYPYSGAIMLFYTVSGFLFVYLWCVLYFKGQLDLTLREEFDKKIEDKSKELANEVSKISDEMKIQTNNTLELDKVISQIRLFNEQRSRIVIEESSEAFKSIIEKAKPSAVTVLDDCQKNRWGGLAYNDWYEVKASFANNELDEDKSFLVTIEVHIKEGVTQKDFNTVYFFLHDTYCPGCIKTVFTNTGGIASLSVTSYAAYTVGIYILETDTKLEMDLNMYDGSPEEYKYQETLFTIKELEDKKAMLEKGNG